jgi:hypothetical protein
MHIFMIDFFKKINIYGFLNSSDDYSTKSVLYRSPLRGVLTFFETSDIWIFLTIIQTPKKHDGGRGEIKY